jgi:hypothetical protein
MAPVALLIQNTALRLYRAPRGSQLLLKLGGQLHTPDPGPELPPTSHSNRNGAITTRVALAAKASTDGSHTVPFLEIPRGPMY